MGTKEEHEAERAATAAERAEAAAKSVTDAIATIPTLVADAIAKSTAPPAPHEHEPDDVTS